jgi:GNAT superfamily N-acetyltransferase
MDIRIVDASQFMPEGIRPLEIAASKESIKNISRLIQEWDLGKNLFNGVGERLLLANVNEEFVGIGGLLRCKDIPGALRVSRFYVLPDWRNKGVATTIAQEVLKDAFKFTNCVTCNALASEIAGTFWETLGFVKVEFPGITHMLKQN